MMVSGLACLGLLFLSPLLVAAASKEPEISFIEFNSTDIDQTSITIKGKLKIPSKSNNGNLGNGFPAVVILHGSAGVDSRGDFYARALNDNRIATLEIDMWEARGIENLDDRPPLPIANYPDAFAALGFLSEMEGIDPSRIGILGFSWGGVVTMASATEIYAKQFGENLRFKAHVAHYPVCYAYNTPGLPGAEFTDLTGAPLMIGIGELDGYDLGSEPCLQVASFLPPEDQDVVEVIEYEGAFHAWDRLQVPITVKDRFSNRGGGGYVTLAPNVEKARQSRANVVDFFKDNL